MEWYAGIAQLVPIREQIAACHDPKDDKFLALAVSGHGDFIVTGDPHLLTMSPFGDIQILSPAAFLQAIAR